MVTLKPRALSKRPSDAADIPLPSDDTTPPVKKMNLVLGLEDRGNRILPLDINSRNVQDKSKTIFLPSASLRKVIFSPVNKPNCSFAFKSSIPKTEPSG